MINEVFSAWTIAFVFAVQIAAGLAKTLAGFGNGSISGSLLALRFDSIQITPANALIDVPLNGYFAIKFRKAYSIKKYLLYAIVIASGSIPGAFLLKSSPSWILKLCVGVLVILIGIKMLVEKRGAKPLNRTMRLLVFAGGGFIGGVFGINVFFVPEYRRMSKSREEFKGSMCFTYVVELLFRLTIYIILGMLTGNVLILAGISALGLTAGTIAGNLLDKRISQPAAELIAVGIMIISGTGVIARTLLTLH